LIDNAYNSQGSVSFAALPASLIASNTTQIASTSKVSTVAVRGTTDTRQLAATVGNPINGDDPDAQELKKRRSSAWEMLES
jgi:hypothetical protein